MTAATTTAASRLSAFVVRALYSLNVLERLSGKSERAPFRGPFSLHNGAKWHLFGRFALPKKAPFDSHNDFPDSLSTLDFSHWAVQQTALLWVPRMPLRLFAGRCRRPTRKNSPKPSQALKSPLLR